jgi:hypothetical protein
MRTENAPLAIEICPSSAFDFGCRSRPRTEVPTGGALPWTDGPGVNVALLPPPEAGMSSALKGDGGRFEPVRRAP